MKRTVLSNQSPALRYLPPDAFTRRVMNPLVAWLTRRGVSVRGSRMLAVRGRRSGELRTTPVNLLTLGGEHYLVSPRGQSQWVRNLRAAGGGQLVLGSTCQDFTAVEVDDAAKPAVLRPYLRRWRLEVGAFFEGVGPEASETELLAAAPRHPVFHLAITEARRG